MPAAALTVELVLARRRRIHHGQRPELVVPVARRRARSLTLRVGGRPTDTGAPHGPEGVPEHGPRNALDPRPESAVPGGSATDLGCHAALPSCARSSGSASVLDVAADAHADIGLSVVVSTQRESGAARHVTHGP